LPQLDVDSWVPLDQAEETAEVFRRAGTAVELHVYPGIDREICDDEIHHARPLLRRVVAAPPD
jgi:predicted esterase